MSEFAAEFTGTMILILMGNGVVANVVLQRTKGHNSGWLVITTGWGLSVFCAVMCVQQFSGAHINPAVTIGLAAAGEFAWGQVPGFLIAQMLGAIVGAALVFVIYKSHYDLTDDADAKLATFCTAPAVRTLPLNVLCEAMGTFVLIFAVLMAASPEIALPDADPADAPTYEVGLGALGAVPVALIVFGIGIGLGGPTGYAINPARDLGPRIAHALLPVPGKRDSDWGYAAVPVIGPILGGLLAAGLKYVLSLTSAG